MRFWKNSGSEYLTELLLRDNDFYLTVKGDA
jgi:hypothetical protein